MPQIEFLLSGFAKNNSTEDNKNVIEDDDAIKYLMENQGKSIDAAVSEDFIKNRG